MNAPARPNDERVKVIADQRGVTVRLPYRSLADPSVIAERLRGHQRLEIHFVFATIGLAIVAQFYRLFWPGRSFAESMRGGRLLRITRASAEQRAKTQAAGPICVRCDALMAMPRNR